MCDRSCIVPVFLRQLDNWFWFQCEKSVVTLHMKKNPLGHFFLSLIAMCWGDWSVSLRERERNRLWLESFESNQAVSFHTICLDSRAPVQIFNKSVWNIDKYWLSNERFIEEEEEKNTFQSFPRWNLFLALSAPQHFSPIFL